MNRLHAPLLLAVALAACTPPSAKRAEHALSRGDYAEARRAIEGGLQKSPDSGDLRALELRLLIADDKRTEAVTRYRKRPSSSLRFAFAESVIWYWTPIRWLRWLVWKRKSSCATGEKTESCSMEL